MILKVQIPMVGGGGIGSEIMNEDKKKMRSEE